jgi:secretion/DNA translocation related TadE-like protein
MSGRQSLTWLRCRHGHAEGGSAAVLVILLVGLLLTVAAASAVVGGLVVGQRRAAAAADLAALAGAERLTHARPVGDPPGLGLLPGGSACGQARAVAEANGTRLADCEATGREVLVRVSVEVRGLLGRAWQVEARARAGPAESLSGAGGRDP